MNHPCDPFVDQLFALAVSLVLIAAIFGGGWVLERITRRFRRKPAPKPMPLPVDPEAEERSHWSEA